MISFKSKFWLIIGIQIFILIFLLAWNQLHLVFGEKVLLKLVPPHDPLSLLQGHYLFLNYEISQLGVGEYYGPTDFEEGETIYVILQKVNKHYKAFAVSRQKPEKGTFIKGKVTSNYRGDLTIEYGIEHYFIPEEQAEKIEKEFRKLQRAPKDLFIEISIDRFGRALIRKMFLGEEELDLAKIGKPEKKIGSREKARDARRIADIRQIQVALELYKEEKGAYPTGLFQLTPEFFTPVPRDPETDRDYLYAYYPLTEPQDFHLGAVLEDINSFSLDDDANFNSDTAGYTNGFNGQDPIYDVSE